MFCVDSLSYKSTAHRLFSLWLLSRILVYTMVNIIVFKSAACTDLACFHQLLCTIIHSVSNVYL